MQKYDLIVLGGGPAGYTAALEAVKSGVKVALVEEEQLGGTCLNRGCIPTKIFLESVDVLEKFHLAENFAIDFLGSAVVNREKLLTRKNDIIETLKSGLRMMIEASSIEVIEDKGKLKSSKEILIEAKQPYTIQGDKIIIATGTREATLKLDGGQYMMGSTEALELKSIPDEVCIIGGGVIGVELATFYSGMGCKVTILEALNSILANLDGEISSMMKGNLLERNIGISTAAFVRKIEKAGGVFTVVYEKDKKEESIKADIVINATGRIPNTDNIGLDSCGIKLDKKGYIIVDKNLKTSVQNIYAAGDVIGGMQLAHVAFNEGTIAAKNAIDNANIQSGSKAVPACIYTHPEMASVGMTEEQAKATYKKLRKGYFPMSANGRSLAAGSNKGVVKVIVDDEIRQIIGVHIVGENATEVIAAAAVAIEGEYTCDEFVELIIAHPTISEAFKDAVSNCAR